MSTVFQRVSEAIALCPKTGDPRGRLPRTRKMGNAQAQSTHPDRFSLYAAGERGLNAAMDAVRHLPAAANEPGGDFAALLVAVGRDRDRQAFIALFNHFAPRLKSFLMKSGMSPAQAEELAQETMLTVWTQAPGYDPSLAGASTWIFTIARNKRIDAQRRQKWIDVDINDAAYIPDTSAPDPVETLAHENRAARIAGAIRDLPPEQAEVVYKSFFEDKTHQQISDETKLPLGTIKSRIRLAMDRLRPVLQRDLL